MKTNTIGTVNNQEIQIIVNDETEFIPLRQVCSALGISYADEVLEVMDNDFVSDEYKLLELVINDKITDSISIPMKYMLGYIGIVSKNSSLEKENYIETKRTILNMVYQHLLKK